jgi:hypothetical protein
MLLQFYIDQDVLGFLFGVASAWCGWMIHKHWWADKRDDIVSTTVEYLCDEGFVKHHWDANDELVLHPWNQQKVSKKDVE